LIYDTTVKVLLAILILQYGFYSGNGKNICITAPVVIFGQEHLFLSNISFNYTINSTDYIAQNDGMITNSWKYCGRKQ